MARRLQSAAPLILVLGLTKVLALLSSAVIARYFDRETGGLVFFVTGLVTLSVSVTTMGLAASSSYYYSRNLRRRRYLRNRQTFHMALLVAVVPSLVVALLALTMEEARSEILYLLVPALAVSCFMAAIRQMARMYFLIENRRSWSLVHDSLLYNLAIVLTILACSALQGGGRLGAVAGLWAVLIASALAGIFALWHTMRLLGQEGRRVRRGGTLPPKRLAWLMYSIALPSMVAQGGSIFLNKIDVLMIGPLAGAVEAGTFSVAMRVTYLSGILTEVVALFLAPKIIAIGASGDARKQWAILKQALALQIPALAVTTLPLLLFREQIIILIFGADYADVSTTYLLLQIGKTLTAVFAPVIALFTALGYNRSMANIILVAAVINVVMNIILIPAYGANGAAISGTVALILMFCNYLRLTARVRRAAC